MEPKYSIGTQFQSHDKHSKTCTITDILKTYNSKGECVKLRYVTTHEFLGQTVTDHDVVETTIARSLFNKNERYYIEIEHNIYYIFDSLKEPHKAVKSFFDILEAKQTLKEMNLYDKI